MINIEIGPKMGQNWLLGLKWPFLTKKGQKGPKRAKKGVLAQKGGFGKKGQKPVFFERFIKWQKGPPNRDFCQNLKRAKNLT